MFSPDRIYGLDIETDNSNGFGLDPRNSVVTEIAVSLPQSLRGGAVLTGDEDVMFAELWALLRDLPPGLFVTWNGSFFDWPFLADRMAAVRSKVKGLIRLTPDVALTPKYDYLPGHTTGYQVSLDARGSQHSHLDIASAYKSYAAEQGVSWSLKPVCAAQGIEMIELDRENLHAYTAAEREAYCLSDAAGTRELAIRTLGAHHYA